MITELILAPFTEVIQSHVKDQVNHVVCHGIPSEKELKEGDILNVDVTAFKDGLAQTQVEYVCCGRNIYKSQKIN